MDLEGTYVVVAPGDTANESLQWIIVRADQLVERLKRRATDAAWQADAEREEPLEAVAAYDLETIARNACQMLNDAGRNPDSPRRNHRQARPTRFGTWGLPGIETGADIHRRALRDGCANERRIV